MQKLDQTRPGKARKSMTSPTIDLPRNAIRDSFGIRNGFIAGRNCGIDNERSIGTRYNTVGVDFASFPSNGDIYPICN